MKTYLPDRNTMQAKGWTHQVQWEEGGRPCFVRCTSGCEADARAEKLKAQGVSPQVIDLADAMQVH